MEAQYALEQAKLEAAHKEQLRLKELEGEEWRDVVVSGSFGVVLWTWRGAAGRAALGRSDSQWLCSR